MKFETKAIHIGEEPNFDHTGDVTIPLHLASTYARKEVDIPTKGHEYSRSDNPTRQALEKRLASLENGNYALAFSSGLAAMTTILLSLLKSGDHIIAFDDLYGGSKRLFDQIFSENFKIDISYVDATKLSNIKDAININTKMIWLETPTNPLLKMCDIQKIAKMAIKEDLMVVVDNTFLSPFFQRPLDLGATIVMHSTTKYINGHSDSVGGCVMTSDDEIYEKLHFVQNAVGTILSPFDSFLVLRGLKTLGIRMQRHEENALKIARFLKKHPKVNSVIYPGLKDYAYKEIALKQCLGFGGMLSFELKGSLEETKKFLEHLSLFSIAESLGGVESLVELPAIMTHASISKEHREKIGLKDSLIRLSVGIEDVKDLMDDLKQAFKSLNSK
ncbi:MAG: PLP-dependent transferase [Campylobacteraceae bacterium]|nr:PLP-dependent transferase [Campylobacteraceae bacterium]